MISKIIEREGNKFFEIDGKLFVPAAFRSFRPTPANVSQFYNNGVRLFQMLVTGTTNALRTKYSLYGEVWKGDGEYDFTAFDRQMEMFMKFAPEGYFCVMLPLDTRDWFLEKYNCPDSFREFGKACFYEEWKEAAADYLKAFINYAEEKYGDRIFSYSFSAGYATEWFTHDRGDYDARKEQAFQKYLKDDEVKIPTKNELDSLSDEFLREKSCCIPDYYKFTSENTAKTVCYFAKKAQEVLQHRKVIGLFYGYMILNSVYQNRWGTAKYELVWQCEDIDMIFSPAAYFMFRETKNPAAYQVAVDSIAVNNKLYMHEIDHRTHLALYPLESGGILRDCYETEEETVMILRRELCQALQKGSALWWFDFYGGYYFSKRYDREIERAVEIMNEVTGYPRKSLAQTAVFYDPESTLYLNENLGVKEDYVNNIICELGKSGVLYDIYNLNDIMKTDISRYKMLVFLNAFKMSEEIRQKLENIDAYKVWIHAPGYENNRNLHDIERIIGMKLVEAEECSSIKYAGETFGFTNQVTPLFEVKNAGMVLAYYEDTQKAAVALNGNNIYSATGNIPYALWHEFEKICGVHIYTHNGIAVYGDSRFICVQNPFSEACSISMPDDMSFVELFDGGEYKTENGVLRYNAPKGTTKMFLMKQNY